MNVESLVLNYFCFFIFFVCQLHPTTTTRPHFTSLPTSHLQSDHWPFSAVLSTAQAAAALAVDAQAAVVLLAKQGQLAVLGLAVLSGVWTVGGLLSVAGQVAGKAPVAGKAVGSVAGKAAGSVAGKPAVVVPAVVVLQFRLQRSRRERGKKKKRE